MRGGVEGGGGGSANLQVGGEGEGGQLRGVGAEVQQGWVLKCDRLPMT